MANVSTFASFKTNAEDSNITEIVLLNDIVLESGVIIPRTKQNLVIDGNGFRITDMTSNAIDDAFRVDDALDSPITITIKNVIWQGRNLNGVCYVSDVANNQSVELAIEDVQYSGPRAVYNPVGLTTISSSTFSMARTSSIAVPEEFAVANRLIFKETVDVTRAVPGRGAIMTLQNAGANLTFSENSVVGIIIPFNNTLPMIVANSQISINITNPKSLLLYNGGGIVFDFNGGSTASPNTMSVSAKQVNMWKIATVPYSVAGGINDRPSISCQKANDTNVTISLTANTMYTLRVTQNITSADKGYPVNTTTFDILTARVLSIGNLPLAINPVADTDNLITGTTESLANLRMQYGTTTINGLATQNGEISIAPTNPMVGGQDITITANWKFLTVSVTTMVFGILKIISLPDIKFNPIVVPYRHEFVGRVGDWSLVISDSRLDGGDWYLYVKADTPMEDIHDDDTLGNAVVLKNGDLYTALTTEPILVANGSQQPPLPHITEISWEKDEGVLLRIDPIKYGGGLYESILTWELYETPIESENLNANIQRKRRI